MSSILKILAYFKFYLRYAVLNIIFNVLSIIFSVFSLTMVIPFLSLLFKPKQELVKMVDNVMPISLSKDALIDNFYGFLGQIIVESDSKVSALLFICILVVVLFFLKNLFRYLALYAISTAKHGVVRDIRNEVYNILLLLPISYYTEERKGDIMSRMTTDAQEVEFSILSSLEIIFKDPLTIIIFLTTMLMMSLELTLFVFILLPVSGLIIGRIGKSLKKTSAQGQEKMGMMMSAIEETLTGMRIIQAFTAENQSMNKFGAINESYKKLSVKISRKRELSAPMSEFLGVGVMIIVMWYGGQLVLKGESGISPELFIGYITIFSQIISPSKSFATAYYNIQKGAASLDRISYITGSNIAIKEKPDAKAIKEFSRGIEYKDISFSYDKSPTLTNINLVVQKGTMVALVGQSGSGKTTLANLLPRFYDPSSGQVLIDGVPITDLKISDLRNLMGIVTQDSILFNDSVFNNIALGAKNATEDEVINAAKIANAHDFIMEMPHGYNTNTGDMGSKLSGGQRQRLSIARAVLKNPPILILDEATSALDSESERLVQEAIFNLMKNRTSVVIAHRLSTIQHADEIIVLHEGKIIDRGQHNSLISKQGIYKKLYDLATIDLLRKS